MRASEVQRNEERLLKRNVAVMIDKRDKHINYTVSTSSSCNVQAINKLRSYLDAKLYNKARPKEYKQMKVYEVKLL